MRKKQLFISTDYSKNTYLKYLFDSCIKSIKYFKQKIILKIYVNHLYIIQQEKFRI